MEGPIKRACCQVRKLNRPNAHAPVVFFLSAQILVSCRPVVCLLHSPLLDTRHQLNAHAGRALHKSNRSSDLPCLLANCPQPFEQIVWTTRRAWSVGWHLPCSREK
jgi:hypothetical protein